MTTRRLITIALLGAALAAGGCLHKDTTHTIYIAPDGSVAWTTTEADVYSDLEAPAERWTEEQAYIASAQIGDHDIARALASLGPTGGVRTDVLRDRRPFSSVTQARFGRIDTLFQRLFEQCGIHAAVSLETDGREWALRMALDFGRSEVREGPAFVLIRELELMRLVLEDGRFLGGGGFDTARGAHAKLSGEWMEAAGRALEERRKIDLSLKWVID